MRLAKKWAYMTLDDLRPQRLDLFPIKSFIGCYKEGKKVIWIELSWDVVLAKKEMCEC